jgi:type VI secretion system ImpM family protein
MNLGATAVGVFGKVPWREEYLRIHASGEPFGQFDAWLTDNVEWAVSRAGREWAEAHRAGEIHAFAFRARDAQHGLLVGALTPSCDSAGRAFPLVVATTVASTPDLARCPEALPLLLEDFWQQASEVLDKVKVAQALEWVDELAAAPLPAWTPAAEALASYEQWARALPLVELWTLIYGASRNAEGAAVLRTVLGALGPYVGVERPKTPLTLRLPLGEAGGAAVCFWIDLVRRAARWGATVPSFFWSHDGTRGSMLLHLGDPPKSTLAELWTPTATRDEFCDLTLPIPAEQVAYMPAMPPRIAQLLEGGNHLVADLMQAAGP